MEPTFKAFSVSTCENIAKQEATRPLLPKEDETPTLFRISDPFGLRKAVVPLFVDSGTQLIGMGTGFHVDEWGTMLTADHVVESVRVQRHSNPTRVGEAFIFTAGPLDPRIYAFLGIGLIFGTVNAPEGAIASIGDLRSPAKESDDPLAALRGEIDARIAADIAVMKLASSPSRKDFSTLPIRVRGWRPIFGEMVLAVGFPEIESQAISGDPMHYLLSEQMYGAYGRVVRVHVEGRDRANPTPVVEVEANWPSGMSGGPVLNQQGEVVGIVSRSILSNDPLQLGTGWAASFHLMPWLDKWVPTVDPDNPTWRRGWAIRRPHPWHVAHFFELKPNAEQYLDLLETGYEIVFGSKRIGADDFATVGV